MRKRQTMTALGGKGRLGITHVDTALLFNSVDQSALLYIEAAAVYSEGETQPLLFKSWGFYTYAAALLTEPRTACRKALSKKDWTFQDFLLADVAQTRSFSFFVKNFFLLL